jgi:hypothetical protein
MAPAVLVTAAVLLLARPVDAAAPCEVTLAKSILKADGAFVATIIGPRSPGFLSLSVEEIWAGPIFGPNAALYIHYCDDPACVTDNDHRLAVGVQYLFITSTHSGCHGGRPLTPDLLLFRPPSVSHPPTVNAGLSGGSLIWLTAGSVGAAAVVAAVTGWLTENRLRLPPRG